MRARGAAGEAGGALSGLYPDPSYGSPGIAGYMLSDDFIRPPDGSRYGDLGWQAIAIGSDPVLTAQTPTSVAEVGILRMSTNAGGGLNEGGVAGWPVSAGRQLSTTPQVGAVYTAKLRLETTTQVYVFSGILQNQAAWWTGSNDVIGFRAGPAGVIANWFGVVRTGSAETTIDLGVAADGTWRSLRWQRLIDDNGDDGIQFYVGTQPTQSHNLAYPVVWTKTGSLVTTNIPTSNALTFCPIAVATRTALVSKSADIDLMEFGGPARRVA